MTKHIQVVRRLVHQDAAAFALPGSAPGRHAKVACGARPQRSELDMLQAADPPTLDQLLRRTGFRAKAILKTDSEVDAGHAWLHGSWRRLRPRSLPMAFRPTHGNPQSVHQSPVAHGMGAASRSRRHRLWLQPIGFDDRQKTGIAVPQLWLFPQLD